MLFVATTSIMVICLSAPGDLCQTKFSDGVVLQEC